MFKTFKLIDKKEEQVGEFQGKMTFHLVDENGVERTVWGMTELDDELNALEITAIRTREHPLVQCLFLTNIGESINIEFTQYNEVFGRKADNLEVTTAEDLEKIAQEMQTKPVRVGALLKSTEVKIVEPIK